MGRMVEKIRRCFLEEKVLYSRHARDEMEHEETGEITDAEVAQAVDNAKIIEEYPGHKSYPSCLLFGRTFSGRPLHVVCAYADDSGTVIVITVYEPDAGRWVDFERRKP